METINFHFNHSERSPTCDYPTAGCTPSGVNLGSVPVHGGHTQVVLGDKLIIGGPTARIVKVGVKNRLNLLEYAVSRKVG